METPLLHSAFQRIHRLTESKVALMLMDSQLYNVAASNTAHNSYVPAILQCFKYV